jgi:hypothetical protein
MERAAHLDPVSTMKQASFIQETLEKSEGKSLAALLTRVAHRSGENGRSERRWWRGG